MNVTETWNCRVCLVITVFFFSTHKSGHDFPLRAPTFVCWFHFSQDIKKSPKTIPTLSKCSQAPSCCLPGKQEAGLECSRRDFPLGKGDMWRGWLKPSPGLLVIYLHFSGGMKVRTCCWLYLCRCLTWDEGTAPRGADSSCLPFLAVLGILWQMFLLYLGLRASWVQNSNWMKFQGGNSRRDEFCPF